jgi:hypothetical protein
VTRGLASGALLAAVVISITGTGQAAATFYLMGNGVTSCGSWTAARRDGQALSREQWVLGFLSGVGYRGAADGKDPSDPLNGMDAAGIFAWIDNYCQARPISELSDAAGAFAWAHPR